MLGHNGNKQLPSDIDITVYWNFHKLTHITIKLRSCLREVLGYIARLSEVILIIIELLGNNEIMTQ